MIEPTDEMVRAFSDADFSECGNADWEDEHVRIGLAAVLAIVERDYDVRRRNDWPIDCAKCLVFIAPWSPDEWPRQKAMTHIRPGGGPDWEANRDHDPVPYRSGS